jgi:PhnB protein
MKAGRNLARMTAGAQLRQKILQSPMGGTPPAGDRSHGVGCPPPRVYDYAFYRLGAAGNDAYNARRTEETAMATTNVKPIPDGHHTITPYVTVADGDAAIAFMQEAFDAKVLGRLNHDNGRLMHAGIQIGDSRLMLSEGNVQHPPMPCALHLYLPDVDATYRRSLAAGAQSVMEPADQFYGDRTGGVRDRLGNTWWLATHIEDVSGDELARRAMAFRKS